MPNGTTKYSKKESSKYQDSSEDNGASVEDSEMLSAHTLDSFNWKLTPIENMQVKVFETMPVTDMNLVGVILDNDLDIGKMYMPSFLT